MNPEQRAAIQHGKGPLRLGAVAGSGKTTALVERVAYLVEKLKVPPERILMISFSRVARDEMKRRIDKRLPTHGAGKCARTFHSIGLDIFNAEHADARDMVIDTTGILHIKTTSEAYKQLDMEPERKLIKRFSAGVKNGLMATPDALRRLGKVDGRMMAFAEMVVRQGGGRGDVDADGLVSAFFRAEDIRQRHGISHKGVNTRFVTFDDMIFEAAQLLRFKDTRERWGERWSYVLQDEAQDVNDAQNAIAQALCHKHRNYIIVGDPCQAIYGFRGAKPQTMLDFDKEWPGAKTIVMHRNYRSGIEIVELANTVMGNMPANTVITDDLGAATDMISERATHAYLGVHLHQDSRAEATSIAANARRHFEEGVPWEEQAVLVRMNRMTRDIEVALAKKALPYKLISGSSFFSLRETKVMVGYLRMATKRAEADDFKTAVLSPSRGVSRKAIETLIDKAKKAEDWLVPVEEYLPTLRPFQAARLREWVNIIRSLRESVEAKHSAHDVASKAVQLAKIDEWLQKDADDGEDQNALEDLNEVLSFCSEHGDAHELLDVVDDIEAHRRDNLRKRKAIAISTVHKAKGREWSVVYLPQLCQGLFPTTQGDVHEERRVFYVAVTRAKDELWLSMPEHSVKDGDVLMNTPSALVVECDLKWSDDVPLGKQVDPYKVGTQIALF